MLAMLNSQIALYLKHSSLNLSKELELYFCDIDGIFNFMNIKENKITKPYRVGILLINSFAMMSYASTVEPMRAANLLSGEELYKIEHLCSDDNFVTSSGGVKLEASLTLKDVANLDILFVIAGGNPFNFEDDKISAALRNANARGVILGGVSAGPYILAILGMMNDRYMTVHWEHAQSLLERLPKLLVTRSLYVMDRDRITCAGGTAPLDMMHALITKHYGSNFARSVSDWFMHTEVRPAGGQQRSGLIERYNTTNPSVIKTIELMENHIANPLKLDQLAQLCDLSPRQLNRLFKSQIGLGTMQFYLQLRLNQARKLCEQSTLSVTEIAIATGFSSLSYFSSKFSNHFKLKPSEIRSKNSN